MSSEECCVICPSLDSEKCERLFGRSRIEASHGGLVSQISLSSKPLGESAILQVASQGRN